MAAEGSMSTQVSAGDTMIGLHPPSSSVAPAQQSPLQGTGMENVNHQALGQESHGLCHESSPMTHGKSGSSAGANMSSPTPPHLSRSPFSEIGSVASLPSISSSSSSTLQRPDIQTVIAEHDNDYFSIIEEFSAGDINSYIDILEHLNSKSDDGSEATSHGVTDDVTVGNLLLSPPRPPVSIFSAGPARSPGYCAGDDDSSSSFSSVNSDNDQSIVDEILSRKESNVGHETVPIYNGIPRTNGAENRYKETDTYSGVLRNVAIGGVRSGEEEPSGITPPANSRSHSVVRYNIDDRKNVVKGLLEFPDTITQSSGNNKTSSSNDNYNGIMRKSASTRQGEPQYEGILTKNPRRRHADTQSDSATFRSPITTDIDANLDATPTNSKNEERNDSYEDNDWSPPSTPDSSTSPKNRRGQTESSPQPAQPVAESEVSTATGVRSSSAEKNGDQESCLQDKAREADGAESVHDHEMSRGETAAFVNTDALVSKIEEQLERSVDPWAENIKRKGAAVLSFVQMLTDEATAAGAREEDKASLLQECMKALQTQHADIKESESISFDLRTRIFELEDQAEAANSRAREITSIHLKLKSNYAEIIAMKDATSVSLQEEIQLLKRENHKLKADLAAVKSKPSKKIVLKLTEPTKPPPTITTATASTNTTPPKPTPAKTSATVASRPGTASTGKPVAPMKALASAGGKEDVNKKGRRVSLGALNPNLPRTNKVHNEQRENVKPVDATATTQRRRSEGVSGVSGVSGVASATRKAPSAVAAAAALATTDRIPRVGQPILSSAQSKSRVSAAQPSYMSPLRRESSISSRVDVRDDINQGSAAVVFDSNNGNVIGGRRAGISSRASVTVGIISAAVIKPSGPAKNVENTTKSTSGGNSEVRRVPRTRRAGAVTGSKSTSSTTESAAVARRSQNAPIATRLRSRTSAAAGTDARKMLPRKWVN